MLTDDAREVQVSVQTCVWSAAWMGIYSFMLGLPAVFIWFSEGCFIVRLCLY